MLRGYSELHIKRRVRRDLKDHEKNVFFASVQGSASAHRENTISAQAASPHQERVLMKTLVCSFSPILNLILPEEETKIITIIHKVTLY